MTHRLRLSCTEIGVKKIDAADTAIIFTFAPHPTFDPKKFFELLQSRRDLRMLPGDRLKMTITTESLDARLNAIRAVINPLRPDPT